MNIMNRNQVGADGEKSNGGKRVETGRVRGIYAEVFLK